LHLHGHWQDPESVVLGIRSYEAVLGDVHAQTVLRSLRLKHTLVFIGCGAGLGDPNLGALLAWSRPILAGSEYRHFRLCRKQEREELEREHPPEERIFPLPFGEKHGDLATFLRDLAVRGASSGPAKSAPPVDVVSLPPRPARCIGREEEVETLVGALLAGEPTPVLGPAGIGKSTVCLQALHDPRVAGRFGVRRYFVRLDGAATAKDLLATVAAVLGIPVGQAGIGNVIAHLADSPAALALDNLETPWEAETLETEALLAQLAAAPGSSLAVTLRRGHQPGGVGWREPIEVKPLGRDDAKRVFLAIAGSKHGGDALLGELLTALDGVPLAIELLAYPAQAEPDLDGLWQRWQTERTAMLRRGQADHRLLNLAVSLELSVAGPSMTDAARRLLSLLGLLPDGIVRTDLETLLPGFGNAAAATLRQVALAFDEARRLRTLAPVREHVAAHHPPAPEDLARGIDHYAGLARDLGPKCGGEGGAEAAARLSAETANIEKMLLSGMSGPEPRTVIEAAIAFAEFQRFSGLGTGEPLDQAVLTSRSIDDTLAARAVFWSGLIAFQRSDHDGARARYEAALPLYRRVGDVQGEANCIKSLGDIAFARSDHDGARERYEAALPLYRRVGDVLGEANCIARLGDIAFARSDHDGARARYEAALPLYRRVGDVLGEANCIKSLGDIALARSDRDGARELFDEALGLYSRIPEPYSIGWAHKRLADVAPGKDERVRQIAAARKAWLSIGRDDLVQQLDESDGSNA
jgi:tetratricopeptide (TPR) repeat protein